MTRFDVGVLGASSDLGALILERLIARQKRICAFSRDSALERSTLYPWLSLGVAGVEISCWVCAAPAWVLPDYFDWLLSCGARRVVMVSSTSRYAKENSPDFGERLVARRLINSEECLQRWAALHSIEWIILRPTLIYGGERDRNISAVMKFVRRWHFFPLAGKAKGLRQPVHVLDVAKACISALEASGPNRAYNLSGSEVLTFREMVLRSAAVAGVRPWLPVIPVWILRAALGIFGKLRPSAGWSAGMADRMNRDQVFDHGDAARELGFDPLPFNLEIQSRSGLDASR